MQCYTYIYEYKEWRKVLRTYDSWEVLSVALANAAAHHGRLSGRCEHIYALWHLKYRILYCHYSHDHHEYNSTIYWIYLQDFAALTSSIFATSCCCILVTWSAEWGWHQVVISRIQNLTLVHGWQWSPVNRVSFWKGWPEISIFDLLHPTFLAVKLKHLARGDPAGGSMHHLGILNSSTCLWDVRCIKARSFDHFQIKPFILWTNVLYFSRITQRIYVWYIFAYVYFKDNPNVGM